MGAFKSRHRRGGRWWLVGVTLAAAAFFTVFFVVGASGSALSGGSTWDINGDLYSGPTLNDWNPPSTPPSPTTGTANNKGPLQPLGCLAAVPSDAANCAIDWTSSSSDNAFGQGTSEDSTSPTVVTGSIPTNKDDLSRFYVNQQTATNQANCDGKNIGTTTCHFLDLAWERTNLLGSAHMDFEFNQANPNITSSSTGTITLNRTAGDILIDFDFGGSGIPTLTLHYWMTTGPTNPKNGQATGCEASNSYPCWGAGTSLSGVALAKVNSATVYDYNPGGGVTTPVALQGSTSSNGTISSTFGEATINLEAAGVFSTTKCTSLGYAWLKSRSSGSSFNSEMKDFIAPLNVSVGNCGYVLVKKDDSVTGAALASASFTIAPGSTDSNGNTDPSDSIPAVSGQAGYYCIDHLLLSGSYTVTETSPPPGHTLPTSGGPATGLSATSGTCAGLDFSGTPPTATVTFHDPPQLGALKIVKTAKNKNCTGAGAPVSLPADNPAGTCKDNGHEYLQNVAFSISKGATTLTGSTDANGVACFTNLAQGTWTITETTPTGFHQDSSNATSKDVGASTTPTSCSTGTPTVDNVNNIPLSSIEVKFTSSAGTGVTALTSTITCSGATTGSATGSGTSDRTFSNLEPDTYTCTVVIDP